MALLKSVRLRTFCAVLTSAVVFFLHPCNGVCATAAGYRRMADAAVSSHQFAQAARSYALEASIYRGRGDLNAAKVEEMKAERWSTRIKVYAAAPYPEGLAAGLYTAAKYEPPYGCYLGAYVASDDSLAGKDEGDREEAFSSAVGKKLATFFDYCRYGEPFPSRWAHALTSRGMAPHIAWEPNDGMEPVKDDDYLEHFARDAASCGGPVFLRFAGEMNGDWTVYHRDPALYREKFKLVHDVMARLAPNVAMVWCVNHIPEPNMDEYYPGDDAVDWVGVNFYSVLHHDNDPKRPADHENPASMLEYVYQKYSGRKPIAICEYGATHRELLARGVDRSGVAANELSELFAELPREFPRVKLLDIFDCNNLIHARAGRQFNDYSVTDSPLVLAALTRSAAPAYFLTHVGNGEPLPHPAYLAELRSGQKLSGVASLSAVVRTYDDAPQVVYTVDERPAARIGSPGEYRLDLDTSRYSPGRHLVGIDVFDSGGRKAGQVETPVVFALAPRLAPASAPISKHALRPRRRSQGGAVRFKGAGGEPSIESTPIAILYGAAALALGLAVLCIRLVLRRR